jgi:hypothetical protein
MCGRCLEIPLFKRTTPTKVSGEGNNSFTVLFLPKRSSWKDLVSLWSKGHLDCPSCRLSTVSSLGTRSAVVCIISEHTTNLTTADNLTSVPPFLDLMEAMMNMEKLLYITG